MNNENKTTTKYNGWGTLYATFQYIENMTSFI